MKTKKEEMKKAKGVKKNVFKKDIKHQDYVDCLFEERIYAYYYVYDHFDINSIPSNRIKSCLSLAVINNICWIMGLALCHTAILVCCKYLRNLSIIFNYFFRNVCNIF